ncbi:unnamed protein product [Strongylus vulgaris]|uniref:Uncharacterized protein n=1 Tax=Strongylus vulgaris TaxID=40348 RepID=A0A3P7JZD5_STRVU|nr:unnamed protein product [Strongylus vulgaris]
MDSCWRSPGVREAEVVAAWTVAGGAPVLRVVTGGLVVAGVALVDGTVPAVIGCATLHTSIDLVPSGK